MKLLLVLLALAFQVAERFAAAYIGAPGNELLWRPLLKGPIMADQTSNVVAFTGATLLASGSATVTVSNNMVGSDTGILLGALGVGNVGSAAGRPIEVKTISPGNFFTLGTIDGVAIARDTTVSWFMLFQS
jgi:hypothetical protein